MTFRKAILGLAAIATAMPLAAHAQDEDSLIIVTGSRVERDDYDPYYDDNQAAIGLTRTADYFVKPIYVNSDSRDADLRKSEVLAMLRDAVRQAEAEGIFLVAGSYTLKPVSLTNIEELPMGRGNRPDTTRVRIFARMPIGNSNRNVDQVDGKIEAFAKSIPATGRSYIESGGTNLAINNPEQYRIEVVKAIADESTRYAAMFGNDYGVEIRGLDSELYVQQASQTEVFIYIGHSFVIKPK